MSRTRRSPRVGQREGRRTIDRTRSILALLDRACTESAMLTHDLAELAKALDDDGLVVLAHAQRDIACALHRHAEWLLERGAA